MDPLSVTLVVVTLATALKDIVETARAMRDSFSKLPQNYRNACKLAEEVFTTLQGLQEIYHDKEAIFDGIKYLGKAVNTLRVQIKSVHDQCIPLIPPVSERKRDRFKIAFFIFRNREKVERLISDLKDHTDRCSQQFILLSNIRMEALVGEIHDTLHFDVYRRRTIEKKEISHHLSSRRIPPDNHFVEFMHSTSASMTRVADDIPAHDLSKAYLRREVGIVGHSLDSIVHWLQNSPAEFEVPLLTISWFLGRRPLSDTILHQSTVVLAFQAQSLFNSKATSRSAWIHDIDIAVNQLCINLHDLQMHEDALLIGTSRANLWKVVTIKYPESRTSSYRLAEALTKLSIVSSDIGDRRQAYRQSEEAIHVTGSLSYTRADYIELLARNRILQAENEQDPKRALELAMDADKILGFWHDTLTSNNFPTITDLSSMLTVRSITCSLVAKGLSIWSSNGNINENIPHDNQFTLATSLLKIAQIQRNDNQFLEANRLAKVALLTLNRLLGIYPGSSRVLDELRVAYTHLSATRMLNSVAENLEYAQESSTIIRGLAQINPQRYVLRLMNALSFQREILLNMSRLPEAHKVYEDMVSLGDLAAAPRHLDLQIPSEIEGDYHHQVAQCHLLAQHPTDAIYAAQNAISQYSALEFMNPGCSPIRHINTSVLLCKSFIAAQQYDHALAEGFKVLKIIDNSIIITGSNPALLESYQELLGKMMEALTSSRSLDPRRALSQAKDINGRMQSLTRSIKVKLSWKVADAPVQYVELLERNSLNEEAVSYLQDLHHNWREVYGDIEDTMGAVRYIQYSHMLPNVLKGMGETEKALRYSEDAILVARKLQSKLVAGDIRNRFFSFALLNITAARINLLCDAGRYREALDLSSIMLSDARTSLPAGEDANKGIAQAVFYHSVAQTYNHKPHEAVATVREGISLWSHGLPRGDPPSYMYSYTLLIALCTSLHDIGEVDEALVRLEEAERAAQRKNRVDTMEQLKSSPDGSYEVLLTMRSKFLFAKGRHSESASLIKEVEIIQRETCKTTKSGLHNLAKILAYSGIVYCTVGRHEEGIAAATELRELKDNIARSSPGLAHRIRVSLDFMTTRGAWKSVQDAKDRLTCDHQH